MIGDTIMQVPGASLRYRMSGTPSSLPMLVFENGWGASLEQWAWVERELASKARLLFYDRAGIGGSTIVGRQTAGGISAQLFALLAALEIQTPVILVGHSYGGLICALHAAQSPARVQALVEIDPTPDCSDPVVDRQLRVIRVVARIEILLATLGIPDPLLAPAGKRLPQPEGMQLVKRSFGSARSLRAALIEIELLDEIRETIASNRADPPRLVIIAGRTSDLKGWAGRLLASQEKSRIILGHMQALHRAKVGRCVNGSWKVLPHDHGALVFSQAGAADCAAQLLSFAKASI